LQALEKIAYSNNWVTEVLLLLFLSVVLLKLLDAKRLKKNFFGFFKVSFIEDEDLDNNNKFLDAFGIVIFFFLVTVVSLLIHNFILYKRPTVSDSFSIFLNVFLVLLVYFLAKRILEIVFSFLFLIKESIQVFSFYKARTLYSLSFLLYIAIVLCEYAGINQLYSYYFAGFLFIARFVLYSVRNKNLIFNKLFYFILYICAFEIAPLFVLLKLMF
jgi:hypothetical protein